MDVHLQDLAEMAVKYACKMNVQYCDARAEQYVANSASIEDGSIEYIKTSHDKGIGIRMLCNNTWGFCSIASPETFQQVSMHMDMAIKGAMHVAQKNSIRLAASAPNKARVAFPVHRKPSMQNMLEIARDCDSIIREGKDIVKSTIRPAYHTSSKYFVSSEGSSILQEFTDVIIHMVATAHGYNKTQSIDVTEGGRGGIEQITQNDIAYNSADNISSKASQLLHARQVKEEKTVLVMNSDFVALLTHEILGHPSEADRVLGREMAWAGGAWWSNKIGQQIGSDALNVFDDPTIPQSLGWYYFDDEGVKAQRTHLVRDGILQRHLQSRETAEIFNVAPTGNMRASRYAFMPLIRMACTCIGQGSYNTDEMLSQIKDGYLISGMKVPSIDMRRYNWSISCQYAQRIKNGTLTDLHRDVIVTGNAPEFLSYIDACGKESAIRPITNCGKGDPMQSMMMGNGGPAIRGLATIKGIS